MRHETNTGIQGSVGKNTVLLHPNGIAGQRPQRRKRTETKTLTACGKRGIIIRSVRRQCLLMGRIVDVKNQNERKIRTIFYRSCSDRPKQEKTRGRLGKYYRRKKNFICPEKPSDFEACVEHKDDISFPKPKQAQKQGGWREAKKQRCP